MLDSTKIKDRLSTPWFVYQYTFSNNKVYICKSNIHSKRFMYPQTYRTQTVWRAMQKYPDYKGVILKYFETESEAFAYEEEKISELKANDPNFGYNNTSGGDGVPTDINYKSVAQYSIAGDFIKKWASIVEAARKLKISSSSIACVCSSLYASVTAGGYQWRYADNVTQVLNIDDINYKRRPSNKNASKNKEV